jgi:hypothetical protein
MDANTKARSSDITKAKNFEFTLQRKEYGMEFTLILSLQLKRILYRTALYFRITEINPQGLRFHCVYLSNIFASETVYNFRKYRIWEYWKIPLSTYYFLRCDVVKSDGNLPLIWKHVMTPYSISMSKSCREGVPRKLSFLFFMLVACFPYFTTMKMEAVRSYKSSKFLWRHFSEASIVHNQRYKNLKSNKFLGLPFCEPLNSGLATHTN